MLAKIRALIEGEFTRVRERIIAWIIPRKAKVSFTPLDPKLKILPLEHEQNDPVENPDDAFLFGGFDAPSGKDFSEYSLHWSSGPIPMSAIVGTAVLSQESRRMVAQQTLENYGPIEERRELWPMPRVTKGSDKNHSDSITMEWDDEAFRWIRADKE